MNWMSARLRREPAPLSTVKREPVIFAARSKSRIPSAGPRSQCASGGKSNRAGSPHFFRTTFAVSSSPSGTSSCGTFGSVSSMGTNRSSRARRFSSKEEMREASSFDRASSSEESSFARRFAPIFCESELRSARAASMRVICCRRSASIASHCSRAPGGTPRCRSRWGRRSYSLLRKSLESMEPRILASLYHRSA